MNQKRIIWIWGIAAIAVIVAVLYFGSGTSVAPSASAPASAATQVIAYDASVPSYISSTPPMVGSCWTNSIAAPYRPDAWRCSVGNGIFDPCFLISATNNVLCGVNPAIDDSTSSFVISLTQPLPTPQTVATPPSDWAWLIKLQDGTVCSPFTGTLPIISGGNAASYGCAPRMPGEDRVILNIDDPGPLWTAEVASLAAGLAGGFPVIVSSSTIPIAEVWQ